MERQSEELLKIRSVRATVSAGFRLYMSNFRNILKLTWAPALLCAVVSALYNHTVVTSLPNLFAAQNMAVKGGLSQSMAIWLANSGLSLLDLIVSLLFMSYAFSMLSHHRQEGTFPSLKSWLTYPDGRMLMRTVASAIVWIVVLSVAGGLTMALVAWGIIKGSITTLGLGVLLLLVMLALVLPMVYPNMRYVTTRDTRLFSILGSGYIQGLRRWGYLFAVLLVTLIFTFLALVITTLPSIVLMTANMKAQTGTLMGDPLGMPGYMTWMSLIVFLLAGFIQCYVVLLLHFPAYYMAGSIEKQEQEKHEKTTNTLY